MIRYFYILLLSINATYALEAEFQADNLTGSLGDIISFGWDLSHSPQAMLSFSEINMEGTGIEILDRALTETDEGHQLMFKAAVYDSTGLYTFPSGVVYAEYNNQIDSLFLRGPDIEISSILTPSDTTFRDIKGTHSINTPFNLKHLILALLIITVMYLVYWLVKRMGTRDAGRAPEKVVVPPEEAHIIALRALETLKRSKYIRFEQFKEFYSELTHILKLYYENRYLVDALEQTTSEFHETMNSMSEFDEQLTTETHQLLEKADYIKFAKARSDELESGEALNLAIDLVNRTKVQSNQGDKK